MPALLKIKRYIENDIWNICFSIDPASLPESDKDLIRKFGEPTINVGGTFGESPDQYTLPEKFIRIKTELPYTQSFDSKSPDFETNTQIKAGVYETVFLQRYVEAFTNLRASVDTFTGESIVNI
jgi:hypothetical protein